MTPDVAIHAAGGLVTLCLPDGAELSPDPADADLLWWIAPGSGGGFSLAVSDGTATPPDVLLSMERSLADRVSVERDEIAQVDGRPVRELRFVVERRLARSWIASPEGRRETPGGLERRVVRRRFWTDALVSAGYHTPEGETDTQALYDQILDSVRLSAIA